MTSVRIVLNFIIRKLAIKYNQRGSMCENKYVISALWTSYIEQQNGVFVEKKENWVFILL